VNEAIFEARLWQRNEVFDQQATWSYDTRGRSECCASARTIATSRWLDNTIQVLRLLRLGTMIVRNHLTTLRLCSSPEKSARFARLLHTRSARQPMDLRSLSRGGETENLDVLSSRRLVAIVRALGAAL